MSLSTVIQIQDAIKRSHDYKEVQELYEMIVSHRHNLGVDDEEYAKGVSLLISVASAATTEQVTKLLMSEAEYEQMTSEYQEVVMNFSTVEEEEGDNE